MANFTNDPRNPQNFELFETMMRYLLMNGFSTEQVSVKKPKDVVSSGKVSISVSSADAAPDAKPSGSDTKVVRFCFHPVPGDPDVTLPAELLCDRFSRKSIHSSDIPQLEDAIKIPFSPVLARSMQYVIEETNRNKDEGDIEQTRDFDSIVNNFKGRSVEVVLRLRSTSAAVEYLGRVIEPQRSGKFDVILIANSEPSVIDYKPCNLASNQNECEPLFVVSNDVGAGAAFGVSYRGAPYVIPADTRQAGNSSYALGIIKQLIGLNNSSESSPVPAVLTGIPTL